MTSFKDFYEGMGFSTYPFLSFTAENETDNAKTLFIKPHDYDLTIDSYSKNITMIITGDRGTGKTAIIYDLLRHSSESRLVVVINEYSSLTLDYSLQNFYWFVIQKVCDSLFEYLVGKANLLNRLDKTEKLLLSYLLQRFVSDITKSHLRERILGIQKSKLERAIIKAYNAIRFLFNYGVSVAVKLINDVITNHFSHLPPVDNNQVKEFFPEIQLGLDDTFIEQNAYHRLFEQIEKLSKKLGITQISVFFDKIDEDQRLENDAEKIAQFAKTFLTDNNFLLSKNYQVVVSIWKTPFQMLRAVVRTQKISISEINWTDDDLIEALDKRIQTFSEQKISSYLELLDDSVKAESQLLLNLSNRNPRDLWHLFDKLLREQYRNNPETNKIGKKAKDNGFREFVRTFNFYEYYPRKTDARATSMDIYSYIRHLLKLASPKFTKNQLNEKAGTGSSTNNYVSGMENIGLVKDVEKSGNAVVYIINDPKVVYALENGIEIRKD